MITTYPTLYKLTTTGKVQIWYMEREGEKYRTISGQLRGAKVTSAWTVAKAKNVGRSNETTPEEQAISEINATYVLKETQKNYKRSITGIENKTYFEPMLAKSFEQKRIKNDDWPVFIQPKLDGMRCIANKFGMFTRNGKEITTCPHIFEELKVFFEQDETLIIDGELYNHDFNDDFNSIISAVKRADMSPESLERSRKIVQYHIYDIGDMDMTFFERKILIETLFRRKEFNYLKQVETHICNSFIDIDFKHKKIFSKGYEGTIVRLDALYENKRTYSLMKKKDFITEEFPILALIEGEGNWSGAAKSGLFQHPNGNTFGASIKGTYEYCKQLLRDAESYTGQLGTVVFQELTPDGVPKFGVLHSIRDYE